MSESSLHHPEADTLSEQEVQEAKAQIRAYREHKRRERLGLRVWQCGEHIVYARNQKNAIRKFKNLGYEFPLKHSPESTVDSPR